MIATIHTLPRKDKAPKPTPPPQPTHVSLDTDLRWKFDYLMMQMREAERAFTGPSTPIATLAKTDRLLGVVETTLPGIRAALRGETPC